MKVESGRLHIVDDGDGTASPPTIEEERLHPLHGTGREALERALEQPGSAASGVRDGLLVSCSCGHLYLAEV